MAKIRIGYRNWATGAVVAGGAWDSAMPPDKLLAMPLDDLARTSDTTEASTVLDIDLGSMREVDLVGWIGGNLSVAASWRITAGSTAGASDLYDSGAIAAYDDVLSPTAKPWDAAYTGALDDQERAELFPSPHHLHHLGQFIEARYWRIQITDTANPDGFIEGGLVWLGPSFQPRWNISTGSATGLDYGAKASSTLSRTPIAAFAPDLRTLDLDFSLVSADDAAGPFWELQRLTSTRQPVAVLFDPDQASGGAGLRLNMVGMVSSMSAMELLVAGYRSTGLKITEAGVAR